MDSSRVKVADDTDKHLSGTSLGVGALIKRKFGENWGSQSSLGIDQFHVSKNSSEIKLQYAMVSALGTYRMLVGSWEFMSGLGVVGLYPVKKETNAVKLSSIKPTIAPTGMISIGHLLRGQGPVMMLDYRHLPETGSVSSRSLGFTAGYVWTL
jgi:hypothetical protein